MIDGTAAVGGGIGSWTRHVIRSEFKINKVERTITTHTIGQSAIAERTAPLRQHAAVTVVVQGPSTDHHDLEQKNHLVNGRRTVTVL